MGGADYNAEVMDRFARLNALDPDARVSPLLPERVSYAVRTPSRWRGWTRAAVALLGLGGAALVNAQPAGVAGTEPPAPRYPEPKVERLVHADGLSRVEELRVGGQTRRIEVQTRSAVPGYEVRPIDGARSDEMSGAGMRRWRVVQF